MAKDSTSEAESAATPNNLRREEQLIDLAPDAVSPGAPVELTRATPSSKHEAAIPEQSGMRDVKLDLQNAVAHNRHGFQLAAAVKYDQAIVHFDEAIRINPNFAPAYNNRGYAHAAKKQYDRAISDFNSAIRLEPGFAAAYNNRALAYTAERDNGG